LDRGSDGCPFATRGKAKAKLPYSRFVVFGDGLSDRVRWGPLTGFRYPPSLPFAEGRWTGGHGIGNRLEYGQPDILAEPPAPNLRAAAERLTGAGARHILIGTMPDVGATALYAGTDKAARATRATQALNRVSAPGRQSFPGTGCR
jgi:phospholipase/lecithinase/hemolysin